MNRLGESREERASEIILGWLGTGAGRRERGVESTEVMHLAAAIVGISGGLGTSECLNYSVQCKTMPCMPSTKTEYICLLPPGIFVHCQTPQSTLNARSCIICSGHPDSLHLWVRARSC